MNEYRKIYNITELKLDIISDAENNKTHIIYQPILETQFHSPGVKISINDNKEPTIEFIRENISENSKENNSKSDYFHAWIKKNPLPKNLALEVSKYSNPNWKIISISGVFKNIQIHDANGTHSIKERYLPNP